jgi:hypothetical protein
MAKTYSYLIPASPTATSLFSGTAGAAQTVTVGFKCVIGITTSGATDATAAAGVHVRFGSALKAPTATGSDWFINPGQTQFFEMGSEFDRVSIFSAGTPTFYVYVYSNN